MSEQSKQSTFTNLRASVTAFVVAGLGLAALLTSAWLPWLQEESQDWLRNALSQLGSLLLVSGAVAVYWDLRGKRDMIDEVLARVRTSEEVRLSGIDGVTTEYQSLPWGDFLEASSTFDLFIISGHTWRGSSWKHLKQFAANPKKSMRVFLPDPEDAPTVAVIAQRLDSTPEQVAGQIKEMAREMAELLESRGADIRIYYRTGDPTYTLYKFDSVAVVTMYSNSRKRADVPALTVRKGTFLSFFETEIAAIEKQSTPVSIEDLTGRAR